MTTVYEAVRLSASVYSKTPANQITEGPDWERLEYHPDFALSGFSAGVFRKRGTNEIVIAYTGTNEWQVADYVFGNIPAALGNYSFQVESAMRLYMRTKATYGSNISFTGHSLGGGLASLMAVYFDRPATVFAPAPFQNSALRMDTIDRYRGTLRFEGLTDVALDAYDGSQLVERERAVLGYSVEGEAVIRYLGRALTIVNPALDNIFRIGSNPLHPFTLHSMLLHAAMLESNLLFNAVKDVPSTTLAMFDRGLVAPDPAADFMSRLLRREWGIEGSAQDQVLDRFGTDVLALKGGDTGFASLVARDALLAAAIEYYYHRSAPTQLFTTAAGRLSFKFSDIGLSSLAASKALPRLVQSVALALSPIEVASYRSHLSSKSSWHIQQGAAPLVWTSSDSENDAVVGGLSVDIINSGDGADIIVGGAGTDSLNGGNGVDILLGGYGDDFLNGGDGDNAADTLVGGEGAIGFDTYLALRQLRRRSNHRPRPYW